MNVSAVPSTSVAENTGMSGIQMSVGSAMRWLRRASRLVVSSAQLPRKYWTVLLSTALARRIVIRSGVAPRLQARKQIDLREGEKDMLGVLAWIIMGLIAGLLAKAIMPGKDPGGAIVTTLLGIVGAIIGGFIGRGLGYGQAVDSASQLSEPGFLMSWFWQS